MPITWQEAERLRPSLRPRIFRSGRGFQAVGQLNLFDRRRSPNREASQRRRRRLAMSGPMPPDLACHFTVGQLAVMRIFGDDCRDRGKCDEFNDAIAARAGVSRSTVKTTKRIARRLGLIAVTERKITGARNDSSVVTVISKEWTAWLNHHKYRVTPMDNDLTDLVRVLDALFQGNADAWSLFERGLLQLVDDGDGLGIISSADLNRAERRALARKHRRVVEARRRLLANTGVKNAATTDNKQKEEALRAEIRKDRASNLDLSG